MTNYGGNIIHSLSMDTTGRHDFASGPYEYYMQVVEDGGTLEVKDLRSFTVYLFHASTGSNIVSADGQITLIQGDVLQVEQQSIHLNVVGGTSKFLVSGVFKSRTLMPSFDITHFEKIYKVNKPWGHELWMNGEHHAYCLKQVALRGGLRTSLQYHRVKQETNVLFEGDAYIHYKSNPSVSNDAVQDKDISRVQISPISSIDIVPNVIHRVESVSDIVLYETSTPHLDDVIRIADDSRRIHGRIEAEHQA